MSTTPASTRPDSSGAQPEPRTHEPRTPEPPRDREPLEPALEPALSERAVEADLLVDIPQLSVDELTLELEASTLLNAVRLEAKGLELGLYLRADFDRLAELAGSRSGGGSKRSARQPRDVRMGLAGLLGDGSDGDADHGGSHSRNGQSHPARERARHAVSQGVKAAGLTAAGLAGGALIESRSKPSLRLQLPRRHKGMRALRDAITDRLP